MTAKVQPYFTLSDGELEAFRMGRPTGPGELTAELNSRGDLQATGMQPIGRRQDVYEFPWGLITEEAGPWGIIWNFYIADVWRAGTANFYDRFLSAWKNDADKVLEPYMAAIGDNFFLSYDDGIACFGSLSLACLTGKHVSPHARPWVANVLLKTLLPLMTAKALDKDYRFEKEWRCF